MNVIDIASWQQGIDLAAVFAQNPIDGVMVKLTQGTTYLNPLAAGWISWLRENGKLWGTYHYLDGRAAKAEAAFYADHLKLCPGGILALDYEEGTVAMGTAWLKDVLDEVTRLTGVKPLVYCSLSVTTQQDFSAIAAAGYRLWMAQYADMREVKGFVEKPWQSGSCGAFGSYVMHQYTSCGRLNGYGRNLDFDKFYGTEADWWALAAGGEPSPAPAPTPEPQPELKGPTQLVISEILHGSYGVGGAREKKLRAAGYDPVKCQAKVNELYGIATKWKQALGGNADYIASITYILKEMR